MKKKLALSGLCLALMIILTACSVSSSAGASRVAERTAKRTDSVVSKIQPIDEKSFNFPNAMGSNFFVCAGYEPQFYNMDDLNLKSPERLAFLAQLDNLYALCADIMAANIIAEQIKSDIRQQAAIMRSIAADLTSNPIKQDWTEFNKASSRVDDSINVLKQSRNSVERKLKIIPRQSPSINPENLIKRYTKVMERLEERASLLQCLLDGLRDMNAAMYPEFESITSWRKPIPSATPQDCLCEYARPQQEMSQVR